MNTQLIFDFLKDLSQNNNRDWFKANKSRFDEARSIFEEMVQHFIDSIGRFEPGVTGLEAKNCVFRIYRDVRFSKDKSPYKVNFAASMSPGGRKSEDPGYYISVKPGDSFIGGGLYHPAADQLKKIRQEIDYNGGDFKKIVESKVFKSTFGELWGDKLKRAPKDYVDDNPMIEYLKMKDFVAMKRLEDDIILSDDIVKVGAEIFRSIHPLNNFLKTAIQD